MHIRGMNNDGNQAGDANRIRHESNPASTAGSAKTTGNGELRNESTLARSPEIARLAEELRRSPEVRPEQVARAQARLASGYYLTQDAAEQTADKLMS